jgi:hypothetical protein
LVLIAYYGGIDAVEGAYHEVTGVALFVIAVLLLFLLDAFLNAFASAMRKLHGRLSSRAAPAE